MSGRTRTIRFPSVCTSIPQFIECIACNDADVISGSAGAVGGVTFNPVDDLALAGANVVRVKAGSVGTPGAEANALIAGDVTSGTFTADASSGDIRLRNVTAAGNLGAVFVELHVIR